MSNELEVLYGMDPPEQVERCLSCRRPACNNCAKHNKQRRLSGQYRVPVYQYDMQMRLINIWPTASHAAQALGLGNSHISSAISGRQKTAGGFIWRREKKEATT